MSLYKEAKNRSPWLNKFLLKAPADEADDCITPKLIRVDKLVAGPFEDGSVRKQVSDGDLFMEAIFSWEAIHSGIIHEGLNPDWDWSVMLLRRYRVRYEVSAVDQTFGGQMVLVVVECNLVSTDDFQTMRGNASFCMSRPKLLRRFQSFCQNKRPLKEDTRNQTNSSVPRLLEDPMSSKAMLSKEPLTHMSSLPRQGQVSSIFSNFEKQPLDIRNFLISPEDQLRLDAIECTRPVEEKTRAKSSTSVTGLSKKPRLSKEPLTHMSSFPRQLQVIFSNFWKQPLDVRNFLISPEDQLRLDAIEEWKSDYVDPSVRSSVTLQQNPSSPIHHQQVAPLLPPKILRDASVQATQDHPTLVDAAVQVGRSRLLNSSKTIGHQTRTESRFQASNYGFRDFCCGDEVHSSESSLRLSCDEEPNDPDPVTTVPLAGLLPPVMNSQVQVMPLMEGIGWSDYSLRLSCDLDRNDLRPDSDLESLHLSCDLEQNDLRPDPNLDLLGEGFSSSESLEKLMMELDDDCPFDISTFQMTTPLAVPSVSEIDREKSTHNPVVADFPSTATMKPSSPKFDRNRIQMLLGRDQMTAEQASALGSFNPPQRMKNFTHAYFKNFKPS